MSRRAQVLLYLAVFAVASLTAAVAAAQGNASLALKALCVGQQGFRV